MERLSPFSLSSKNIVTPDGIRPGAVLIENRIISDIVPPSEIPSRFIIQDVGDLFLLPGLVDTHVHINEPGRTDWEGFETATKSAAAGGITTLIDMPLNSTPVTTTVASFEMKKRAADGKLFVDCGFYAGLVPGNENEIEPLIKSGVFGVKAFLTHSGIDDFPNATEKELRTAMPIIAKHNVPLLVHAELESREKKLSSTKKYSDYLSSRPGKWEHDAIELMIHLCREYNCMTHIVHLSSSDEVPTLESARRSGLPLTVETCPHYVYFKSEEIPDGATQYKCAPPIRENENRELLWKALQNGVINMIVSDHSPCPPELKLLNEGNFMKAWGGISSLQFGLSIIWTEAKQRGFTLFNVARWMSGSPATLIGIGMNKGSIAPGFDADILVFNPEKSFIVSQSMIQHRHKVTPYDGRTFVGEVVRTYLRGSLIYESDKIIGSPTGRILIRS
ncbi:MAG: allantoinase AllB [Ignavibacteriales bacterium]|nr:allantoinase AllB [Ignavibacteriales bacterium]